MDDRLLDVDQHGVLRISRITWLSLILLARHWIWAFLTLLSTQYGGTAATETMRAGASWWPLVGQLPTVLLIFAAGRRLPDAGRVIRALWRAGAFLVGLTVCLNLAWVAWSLSLASEWQLRPELLLLCFGLLDLVIASDLCFSKYAKQLFAEFPEPDEVTSKG